MIAGSGVCVFTHVAMTAFNILWQRSLSRKSCAIGANVDAGVSIQTRTLSGWLLVVIRRNDDRFLAV
jgi:hypothetical protein